MRLIINHIYINCYLSLKKVALIPVLATSHTRNVAVWAKKMILRLNLHIR